MLAIARERAKESGLENSIEFKAADAESFSCPNWAFDAVLSRWGLMFLPDLPGTLRRMREVLVPGGRIAAAVWSSPSKVPMLNLVIGTVMNEIGVPPPPPGTPGPFSLADENVLREKFGQAGFQDVKVEKGIMNLKVSSPEEFTSFHKAINAPIKAMMAGQPAARQGEIWNAITEAAREHADPATGGITLPNEVIYVSAKK
jgi:SAM-dependent methyltransferase